MALDELNILSIGLGALFLSIYCYTAWIIAATSDIALSL